MKKPALIMLRTTILILIFHVNDVFSNTIMSKGFDAFLQRPISANVTCGSPPEEYFNTKEGYVSPRLRKLSTCNASDPTLARPASFMVDGNLTTSWQSRNDYDKAFISIALEQPMYGKQIMFKFGDYRRPGQIAIYKSTNYGASYHPWHFIVSQKSECTSVFGIPPNEIFVLPDEKINRVLCRQYPGVSYEYGEEVLVELNGDMRGDGSDFYESDAMLKWMNVTNVHIRFSGLYRKYDYMDTRWHHYAVSQISLIARCDCNGHGDGVTCPMNEKGKRECVCNDNTCGAQCERCCPAYNQYPWRKGSRTSWTSDNSTKCEACNCHDHSNVCRYNQQIEQEKKSLNIHGKYSGGGECLSCKHNTEGINCERCQQFHYQPPNVPRNSLNACPACGCSIAGSSDSFVGLKFLECVRDTAMAAKYPGKNVGDCFCKKNVIGAKCDICLDGYYRLQEGNKDGCRPCSCFLDGTVQRLNLCHKDFFGQCPCKKNVKLRDCSMCKDGYYGLDNDNKDGCKWCGCDVGASINLYVCNKYSGVCTCRPHIYGRNCNQMSPGYFFPDMHYIQGRRNLFAPPTYSIVTILDIPRDSNYKLLIGYQFPHDDTVQMTIRMKKLGSETDLFAAGKQPSVELFECDVECFEPFEKDGEDDFPNRFFLKGGKYSIEIRPTSKIEKLKLDRIIAIPFEYTNGDILSEEDKSEFQRTCSVESNDLRKGTPEEPICRKAIFSMTVKFEGAAIPCGCNEMGSYNSSCQQFGGECYCKPGVGGRDCSYCLPMFHNFTTSGCIPCGCKGDDKICNPITGQCNCPKNTRDRVCNPCLCNNNSNECLRNGTCINCEINTMGESCEKCKLDYYGNALKGDCKACNCDTMGSYNKSCDMKSGHCYCQPGVIGKRCSECAPNYYGMSVQGCEACNCEKIGVFTMQCSQTGTCLCLPTTRGNKCKICKEGYYGLPDKKCEECACNTTGTFSTTVCTNDNVGQCTCKKGVQGRSCDSCQKQHYKFSEKGCTQCPLCTRKLQSHADKVEDALEKVKSDLKLIGNLTALQTDLYKTEQMLNEAQLNAVYFEQRLMKGEQDYEALHDIRLKKWNSDVTNIMKKIIEVKTRADQMTQLVENGAKKATSFYNVAVNAHKITNEADSEATSTFTHIVKLNNDASKIIKQAYAYIQNTPSFNFEQYVIQVNNDLGTSNKVLSNVSDIGKMVDYQERFADALSARLTSSEQYFKKKQRDWSSGAGSFMESVQTIYVKGKEIETLLNQTAGVIEKQKSFITSTRDQQANIQSLLVQMDAIYKETEGIYEKTRMHTQMIRGGVEVLFLQYNPQNSIVRVNVLRGYSLVPRDYSTMKSDPYFRLSISPQWFSQRPQVSEPKFGTLNPAWDWPIGGTYSFLITTEQMKVTKLNISIYDYDGDSGHDFMGEVIVDLATILPIIKHSATQKTYTLKPQGAASLDAQFPGVGENGLLDLQQMLKSQIVEVDQLLIKTNRIYSEARVKSSDLQVQAQLLSSTFDQAKRYASTAVKAVNTYNEIYRLINTSLDAAVAANNSVQDITQLLKGISVSSFKSKTNMELLTAKQFYDTAIMRNITEGETLQNLLKSANSTFKAALPQWNEINTLFPKLKEGIQKLRTESFTASVLEASLQGANIMISQAVTSADQVLQETETLLKTVNGLSEKFEYLKSAPENITGIIDRGNEAILDAELKLPNQTQQLDEAIKMEKTFAVKNVRITSSHLTMEEKLKKIRAITIQLPFTIMYEQQAYSKYKLKDDVTSSRQRRSFSVGGRSSDELFTVVQFDFKPKETKGILFYLLSDPPSMTGSLGIFMQDGHLFLAYNLGHGNIVGRIDVLLHMDKWYTVHVTRAGKEAFFVIRDSTGYVTNKKLTSPHSHDHGYFPISRKTRWYQNGFPKGLLDKLSASYGSFSGTYDNMHINGQRYNLWDSEEFDGVRLYAEYKNSVPKTANGSTVTLFGSGYIKHKVGEFSISSQNSAVELEFRTLKDNIVIFGVTGSSGSFVYSLFISGGKLMFQFATSLGNNIALITTRNTYNNGHWYKVKVARNGVNATLEVTPLNLLSQHLAEKKVIFIGVTNLPVGVIMVFGSASSYGAAPPPVRGSFAGELRNLHLSDGSGALTYRSYNSSEFILEQKGQSYYGMIPGQIVPGIRFYGHMWWEKRGSYSLIESFKSSDVKSIYMSFKTNQLSGLLIYKKGENTESHLYMGLVAGNILIIQKKYNDEASTHYITEDLTLADEQWHNMSLAYTYNGYQLRVDNKITYTGWFGENNKNLVIGKGLIYVGGIPSNVKIDFKVPTTRSIEIDVENFLLNRMKQNFLASSVGVSSAGIKPGLDMAQPPPSCAAQFPDLLFAPDPVQVRFGKAPWAGVQSFLGYYLPNKVIKEYFVSSFVITMSFRAAVGDGIVFYIADNETAPTQYVALEMINGRLRYEFFNGAQRVTIETGNMTKYYGQGQWYKVYLLRIYQFGAMLVPETMEYKNNRHNSDAVQLQLKTPLYIGGLPDHVNAPNFKNRKYGYNGCLRMFEISAGYETYSIDFTKPDVGGTRTGTTACYSNTEPGVYFNGKDSWVHYTNNFVLPSDFAIEIRFRTYRREGTLLYLFSRQTPRGVANGGPYGSYMLLELNNGKIQFHYKASLIQHGKVFEWKDTRSDPSYYLCNQKWHIIKISKVGPSITISVDSLLAFGGGTLERTNSGLINGDLWIGGVRGDIQKPGIQNKNFEGCLELLALGTSESNIQKSLAGNNVIFGCPTF